MEAPPGTGAFLVLTVYERLGKIVRLNTVRDSNGLVYLLKRDGKFLTEIMTRKHTKAWSLQANGSQT